VGILFATLVNLVFVTLVFLAAATWQWPRGATLVGVAVVAGLAGVLSALYVGRRSGIHAFLGGMISIPLIGLVASNGDWQAAIYAGAFCAFGGLLLEKFGPERFRATS
jgi:hypothetical protein